MSPRIMLLGLAATAALALVSEATGQAAGPRVAVLVNNRPQCYAVAPMVVRGRVLVPMRATFQALGAAVNWDDRQQVVTAVRGGRRVSLTIGSTTAMVNGKRTVLDVAPAVFQGLVFVPLRFVSEALGDDVRWDQAAHRITIASFETEKRVVERAADAPRDEPPPLPGPPKPSGEQQTVEAELKEWAITLAPAKVSAGTITFEVTNGGTYPHALAIEGRDERSVTLDPGQKTTLTVEFDPGTYILYGPLDQDRSRGMEVRLTVE